MQCCDRFLYYYIHLSTPTLPKPHYHIPSTLHHILASLVKGRWIDGKAQTVSLLRFTCDISVFFYLPNFSAVKTEGLLSYRTLSVSLTPPLTIPQSQWRKTRFSANASSTFIKSNIEKQRASLCQLPLHKGAKSDTALPTIFQNLTTPIQNHRHRQSTDACNGRTKSLHGRSDHKRP